MFFNCPSSWHLLLLWLVLFLESWTKVARCAIVDELQVDDSGEMMMQSGINGADEDDDLFPHPYEYYKSWSRIYELFPTADMLNEFLVAWETNPLYLPSSRSTNESKRFSHLIRTQDVWTILNQTGLVHGQDYTILKYLMRDGEEWNGQIPLSTIPLSDISMLLQNKAFSLVIQDMQAKWTPILELVQDIELELLPASVSCNLYWTPPSSSRAFETHMDWMDVIVIQLYGEKDWSVWNQPMIQWVLPDEKRKPTRDELKSAFRNIRMSPGDILYIPRGFLHNATTPPLRLKSSDTNNNKDDMESSSLHLTVGIEHGFYSTMEALLHHALSLFVNADPQDEKGTVQLCGKQVPYRILMHWAISDVTRRTNCGGFGEKENDVSWERKIRSVKQHICAIRKSVPLHPQINGNSNQKTKRQFIECLNTVASTVSILDAVQFAQSKAQPIQVPGTKSLDTQPYTYPGMSGTDYFQLFARCDIQQLALEIAKIKSHQESFRMFAHKFARYGQEHFVESQKMMVEHIHSRRVDRWAEQRRILAKSKEQHA